MIGLIKGWLERRAKAASQRKELMQKFESFLEETAPLVPRENKHPKAALYRHAWRRATVLNFLYKERSNQHLADQYSQLEKFAGERYFSVAPETLYGKAPLQMGEKTATRLLEFERRRLFPNEVKSPPRPLACIYMGKSIEDGRVYVGQTVGAPEFRHSQHRENRTGPFKDGNKYVEWKIIEGEVDPTKLNERESYWIGYYDAYKAGYNDTTGNNWQAYKRGQSDRSKRTPP